MLRMRLECDFDVGFEIWCGIHCFACFFNCQFSYCVFFVVELLRFWFFFNYCWCCECEGLGFTNFGELNAWIALFWVLSCIVDCNFVEINLLIFFFVWIYLYLHSTSVGLVKSKIFCKRDVCLFFAWFLIEHYICNFFINQCAWFFFLLVVLDFMI